ncbi:unnamed protein product [Dimorphilus gyrociliatus]|uniref:Uncharacterized protein n=1 Tax=Dimorphilus gyrociliatus TaxID=2664684 RepID=A0A7I8WE73_9ANNE|nr:unnamed protein product [Dimorphilus gyrociliatus]
MSEFIKSIQHFDMIIQDMTENAKILKYSDTLNCKEFFMEKQTLMTLNVELKTAKDTLFVALQKLISQFLFILLPTTETIKFENRATTTNNQFALRLMCSDTLNVTCSTGIFQINVMEKNQTLNEAEGQWVELSFELHKNTPIKKIISNGMVNFQFDLSLCKTSSGKDRHKSDKDSSVASFRYYLSIKLEKFEWNNREFYLHINTRMFAIISQTSQIYQGKANIWWFNFFREDTEKPWNEFKKVLLEYYHTNTGKRLTSQQINYLRHRFSKGLTFHKLNDHFFFIFTNVGK